jgi:hypothetical protein
MSSLVAAGKLTATAAVVPILVGMTANAVTKWSWRSTAARSPSPFM